MAAGRPRRVRLLLESSRAFFVRGGLEELSYALLRRSLTGEELLSARREVLTMCFLGKIAATRGQNRTT
jgi:hypothetical protein